MIIAIAALLRWETALSMYGSSNCLPSSDIANHRVFGIFKIQREAEARQPVEA